MTGLSFLWPPFEVSPCTLFGAVGDSVEGGGVRGPTYYLVGDIHKITFLEVIDSHRHECLVRQNGALYHTHHFTFNAMEKFNRKILPNYRCLAPIFHGLTIYKWRKYDRMPLEK